MTKPGRCQSCRASIVWAWMPTGKPHPFEIDPSGDYEIVGDHAKRAEVETTPTQTDMFAPPVAEVAKKRTRYVSHFAKCPDAAKWRGPR